MNAGRAFFSPREIVSELDRYIVGQNDAKRAVAIALRNRWRRQQLPEALREEVLPKNILMIGPTGCGKTEIARRLARLAQSPFLKVEATKFTEIGYVGRDVEQIIRDLLETAILMTRERMRRDVEAKAEEHAEERLLSSLVGEDASVETREKFRRMLRSGELDNREIEIELMDHGNASMPTIEVPGMPGAQMGMLNLGDIFGKAFASARKPKRVTIPQATEALLAEESDKLLDQDRVLRDAISETEQNGIVFLDEIDKITARSDIRGAEVSREGVQRDLLPLIEGTTVATKHGVVKTDHILFVASGAFHLAKPADLLPELQGRLPIRVELKALTKEDFVRIPHRAGGKPGYAIPRPARDGGSDARLHGGCSRRDRRDRIGGKPGRREHRRTAAAYDHGTAAGRNQLHGHRPGKREDPDRCGLCPRAGSRPCEGRRSFEVHSLSAGLTFPHPEECEADDRSRPRAGGECGAPAGWQARSPSG